MAQLEKGSDGELVFVPGPKEKVFSVPEIAIGTLIGGPLAGCYMMSENYRAMERLFLVGRTKMIGIIATLLIFGAMVIDPTIPRWAVVIGYTLAVPYLAKYIQGDRLRELIARRRGSQPLSEVLRIGFSSLAICIGYAVLLKIFLMIMSPIEVTPPSPERLE